MDYITRYGEIFFETPRATVRVRVLGPNTLSTIKHVKISFAIPLFTPIPTPSYTPTWVTGVGGLGRYGTTYTTHSSQRFVRVSKCTGGGGGVRPVKYLLSGSTRKIKVYMMANEDPKQEASFSSKCGYIKLE